MTFPTEADLEEMIRLGDKLSQLEAEGTQLFLVITEAQRRIKVLESECEEIQQRLLAMAPIIQRPQ